jgi:predicted transcriptional regulator
MSLKHLIRIVDFLKNQDVAISKTKIRDGLQIDYNTVTDIIDYLIGIDEVEVIDAKFKIKRGGEK